jgi:hypothetical protein
LASDEPFNELWPRARAAIAAVLDAAEATLVLRDGPDEDIAPGSVAADVLAHGNRRGPRRRVG